MRECEDSRRIVVPGAPRRLAEMTWPEVAAAVAAGATTVILPLGATEQHGPHLPLGTDTYRATALAERLLALLPDTLLAPAFPIGCSDEHTGFAGLLSLNTETMAHIIVDCARRMVVWGVQRLVLLSAHGGNTNALALAVERLHHELPTLHVWPSVPTLPSDETIDAALLRIARTDGIAPEAVGMHAGEGETSEMLHLRPDLVRQAQRQPGYCGDMTAIMPRLRAAGLRSVTPNGVLGDPTAADAIRGARYLDAAAAAIAAVLDW